MDRAVLLRELVELGVISAKKGAGGKLVPTKPGTGGGTLPDGEIVEPPSLPLNVLATGGFSSILVEWDAPAYKGHAYTEILRADSDNFSIATAIATTAANLYQDSVGADKEFYYWVRFVNKLDIKGPVQSTNGVRGKTEADIGDILDQLKGNIDQSFLTPEFNSQLINTNDSIKRNENGIIVLQGEVQDVKTSSELLMAEGELLAEAVMENSGGIDNESTIRRKTTALVNKEITAVVSDQGAMAQEVSTIKVRVGDSEAAITESKTAIITLDQKTDATNGEVTRVETVLTERITVQESELAQSNAKILTNQQTIAQVSIRTDQNGQEIDRVESAISERLDALTATVGQNSAGVITNQQAIVTVKTTADGNKQDISVLAQEMVTVQSQLGDTTAKVVQNTQTIATINSDGSSAYKAQWGVKASIGDIQAGIGLTVKRETGKPDISQCTIIAGQFSVGVAATSGAATVYPFIVAPHPDTGVPSVFIDTAYIKAARIQDLVAGEVIADNIKAAATLTAPDIKGGKIAIGSKFSVDQNGNMISNDAVIANAYVQGNLNASSGTFNNVLINENCDVRGTIYANKIVGDVVSGVIKPVADRSIAFFNGWTEVFSATYKSSTAISRSVYIYGFNVAGIISDVERLANPGVVQARIKVDGVVVLTTSIPLTVSNIQGLGDEGGTILYTYVANGNVSGGKYIALSSGRISVEVSAPQATVTIPSQNVMLQLVPIGSEFN